MSIADTYARAINSSSLAHNVRQTVAVDVLGAYGLASRDEPLAVALERLFLGDNHAAKDVVKVLIVKVRKHAKGQRIDMGYTQAHDIACCCLAWHRAGTCRVCGGHGYKIIPGTVSLGVDECPACDGTGKIPYSSQFHSKHRELADWLLSQVQIAQSSAGPAAIRKLGSLEL